MHTYIHTHARAWTHTQTQAQVLHLRKETASNEIVSQNSLVRLKRQVLLTDTCKEPLCCLFTGWSWSWSTGLCQGKWLPRSLRRHCNKQEGMRRHVRNSGPLEMHISTLNMVLLWKACLGSLHFSGQGSWAIKLGIIRFSPVILDEPLQLSLVNLLRAHLKLLRNNYPSLYVPSQNGIKQMRQKSNCISFCYTSQPLECYWKST